MSLPALRLDDLTWEDLRALAQRQIPAASGGRWTQHSPTDPGVTLLELFAFLIEQQVFVLDQVPPPLTRAVLALAGEAPLPAATARSVVAAGFSPGQGFDPTARPPLLPSGAQLSPVPTALSDRAFTTTNDVQLLPIVDTRILAGGRDITPDLAQGRCVAILTDLGGPGMLVVRLSLQTPILPEMVGAEVGLLINLTDDGVPPGWAAEAQDLPPPSRLEFREGVLGTGLGGVTDGTGGLRRSGILRVPIPAALQGKSEFSVRIETERVAHSVPPVLKAVHVNAVPIEHRAPVTIDSGAQPGSSFASAHQMLVDQIARWVPRSGLELNLPDYVGAPLIESIRLGLTDRSGTWQDWAATGMLLRHGSADRVFSADRAALRLSFGDGYSGRVPAPVGDVRLRMDVGGGPEGNMADGLTWVRRDGAPLADYALVNRVSAAGGADPETLDEARDRVASSLLVRHRAVTADDYRTLVETTPGIAGHRVAVLAGHDPCLPCAVSPDAVAVFVVPWPQRPDGLPVPAAPIVDPGALSHIRGRLDQARLIGTEVFVEPARYRAVSLRLRVAAMASSALTEELRTTLARFLDPAVGGPDGDGWPFGRPLRPSGIVRAAQDQLGPRGTVESAAIALDGGMAHEDCTDTAIGPSEQVWLAQFRVDYRATQPEGDLL